MADVWSMQNSLTGLIPKIRLSVQLNSSRPGLPLNATVSVSITCIVGNRVPQKSHDTGEHNLNAQDYDGKQFDANCMLNHM